jgi:hypothetical protein
MHWKGYQISGHGLIQGIIPEFAWREWGNPWETSVIIADLWAEIRIRDPPTTKQIVNHTAATLYHFVCHLSTCEIWASYCGEDVDVGLLGYAVWTCRQIPTFRRNVLPQTFPLLVWYAVTSCTEKMLMVFEHSKSRTAGSNSSHTVLYYAEQERDLGMSQPTYKDRTECLSD